MPPSMSCRRRLEKRCQCGFTLLELLAACTVTLVMISLVFRAFSSATFLWRHAEDQIDVFREARAAGNVMVRDLEMTAPAFDAGPPMLVIGYDPGTPPEDRVNEEVYAVSSLENMGKGDLCAVGYRCVWDSVAKSGTLLRLLRDSDATFAAFKNAAGAVPTFQTLYSRAAAPNVMEEEVARNVWDLTFRPCENGIPAAAYPDASYSDKLPEWIEIRFKTIGSRAAEKLQSLPVTRETWEKPGDPLFEKAIEPFLRSFVFRAKLHAASRD